MPTLEVKLKKIVPLKEYLQISKRAKDTNWICQAYFKDSFGNDVRHNKDEIFAEIEKKGYSKADLEKNKELIETVIKIIVS
jgi:hypothetical protein